MIKKLNLKNEWKMVAAAYDMTAISPLSGKPENGALVKGFDGTQTFLPQHSAIEFMPKEGETPFPVALLELAHHPLAFGTRGSQNISGWEMVIAAQEHYGRLERIGRPMSGTILTYAGGGEQFVPGLQISELSPAEGSNISNVVVDLKNDALLQRQRDALDASKEDYSRRIAASSLKTLEHNYS